jgi:hypothetical protein
VSDEYDQGASVPDRAQTAWKAIMRSFAIKAASERAQTAYEAAKWLATYGRNCVGKDAATVSFTPLYASSCVGVNEAKVYIENAMMAMLPTIIAEAEDMASRDLDALIAMVPLSDSDRSREASETGTGSTEGESAGRNGIVQTNPGDPA